jgi:anthranilate synthase component II
LICPSMAYVYIDHYDSFTRNLLHFLGPTEYVFTVDDQVAIEEILKLKPQLALVISPGGGEPRDWVVDLVKQELSKRLILGVCLGMQTLCLAFGARLVPCQKPFHGTTRLVTPIHEKPYLPKNPFHAASYNSLTPTFTGVGPNDLSSDKEMFKLAIDARDGDGEIQAVSGGWQKGAPFLGVQFHPESFLSEGCEAIGEYFRNYKS